MDNVKESVISVLEMIVDSDMNLSEYFLNEKNLGGIGLTSLQYIQLIVLLEETFGIEFGDDAFQDEYYKDINKLVDYIEMRV